MNEQKPNPYVIAKEPEIDWKGLFLKFLYYWPLFAVSIIVCALTAFIYLRFQVPQYEVSSLVFVNEGDKKSQNASSPLASMQDLGMLTMTNSFDNELVKFKSRELVKTVVDELELYIEQYQPSTFGYDIPCYKNTPFHIFMSSQEAEMLESPIQLELNYRQGAGLKVKTTYKKENVETTIEQEFKEIPAVLTTPVGVITISLTDLTAISQESVSLLAVISNPTRTAIAYVRNLSVNPYSKTTTFANVKLKNTVKARGVDFINSLVINYNKDANEEKNEVAQKTAEFIQERIGIINSELGTTENRLADFKQKSGLTNLESDAQMALQESSKYEQQRTENATQIRLVQFLNNYINDPVNRNEVIPANVGLKDASLASVIDQYNTMILEYKRLLRTSSESNPAVIQLSSGIEVMRRNVRTTVNSVLKGLEITRDDINRQASKFEAKISNAPKQEKEFMSISRQQEIQAALYIMLLEKREENAITLASTANNGRILEAPMAGIAPVAPKKILILFAAFILGFIIATLIAVIRELMRYKIENIGDVKAITKLPVIGQIPLSEQQPTEGAIVLQENKNTIMEETFRSLRTNLLFMLEKNEKVILFTSSMPTEGKSFIAGNLAVSMAYLGKKVLVMGLDIRKPGLNKVFNLSRHAKGITDYLSNPEQVDLFSLIQHSDINSNLDIIVGGTIPPNPTELVARESLEQAMEILKKHYDYILLDTAPVAMVTDTDLVSRVADMGVYVCRSEVTPKSNFDYVNELNEERKFKKLAVVLNGMDLRKHIYGYGKYGYGKYGYSKYGYSKYGYGKYGEES